MIPQPKPSLPDDKFIDAILRRICVHLALDKKLEAIAYRVPDHRQPWQICSACADELDRRLHEWNRDGMKARADAGRVRR